MSEDFYGENRSFCTTAIELEGFPAHFLQESRRVCGAKSSEACPDIVTSSVVKLLDRGIQRLSFSGKQWQPIGLSLNYLSLDKHKTAVLVFPPIWSGDTSCYIGKTSTRVYRRVNKNELFSKSGEKSLPGSEVCCKPESKCLIDTCSTHTVGWGDVNAKTKSYCEDNEITEEELFSFVFLAVPLPMIPCLEKVTPTYSVTKRNMEFIHHSGLLSFPYSFDKTTQSRLKGALKVIFLAHSQVQKANVKTEANCWKRSLLLSSAEPGNRQGQSSSNPAEPLELPQAGSVLTFPASQQMPEKHQASESTTHPGANIGINTVLLRCAFGGLLTRQLPLARDTARSLHDPAPVGPSQQNGTSEAIFSPTARKHFNVLSPLPEPFHSGSRFTKKVTKPPPPLR
ncbi:hypothetical protein E5288_WYG014469 [Bos mutus]|uniref:Uncharacterized protein n=1 Tax=Bos mutus TaxID=72004 RepID=A0A6B0R5U9_9CETA|nr:hypothetical protein [Bos mutus]